MQSAVNSMDPPDLRKNRKVIRVSFRTIAHFYDPDDPSPENRRELTDRAEELIVHEVATGPDPDHASMSAKLEIKIPATDLTPGRENDIPEAIRSHFASRAVEMHREKKLIQRVGLREIRLTVGVTIPALVIIGLTTRWSTEPVVIMVQNLMVIFMWVVIWQPFQSLVFDRWTKSKESQVYREIAKMEIEVLPA
jgi:hypothetical protein